MKNVVSIYRNLNWGQFAADAKYNDVPTSVDRFAKLTAPGGVLPDEVSVIWIGPNSEADSCWLEDGSHQGQPFLISVKHPFVGLLRKDVRIWQNGVSIGPTFVPHLLELHYMPLIQGVPQGYPIGGLPMERAPMRRYEAVALTAGGGGSATPIPVFGRKRVALYVDNAGNAEAVNVTLQAAIGVNSMSATVAYYSQLVNMTTAAVAVGAGARKMFQVVNSAVLTGQDNAPWDTADWVSASFTTSVADKTVKLGWVALD